MYMCNEQHSPCFLLDIDKEDNATPAPVLLIKVAHSCKTISGFDKRDLYVPTDAALFVIYGGMSGFRSVKCHLLNAVTRSGTLHKPIKPNWQDCSNQSDLSTPPKTPHHHHHHTHTHTLYRIISHSDTVTVWDYFTKVYVFAFLV